MPPAARAGDLHSCPAPSHVGGPLSDGSPTVRIGGLPAARVGDQGTCNGAVDTIVQGSPTVFIENRPAARAGDKCAHAGIIAMGCPTVIIGNEGAPSPPSSGSPGAGDPKEPGGGSGGTATDEPAAADVHGSPASTRVVGSLATMALVYAGGGGASTALQTAIRSVASQLEVALARGDLGAIPGMTGRLEELLQKAAPKGPNPEDAAKAAADAGSPTPAGSPIERSKTADPPQSVVVREGRVAVNDQFVGLHAISEFDLLSLQTGGRIGEIVRRLAASSAAGRNCVRIFCMYENPRGQLLPRSTPGYWTAVESLVKRLAGYGMFGEFVLLADCERRSDGSGGAMPSWDDRRAFVREAGQFFRGKKVIVNGMNEPSSNGAAAADDPRLLELMRVFRDESGATVPFSIGDPTPASDEDTTAAAVQERLAGSGASLLVLHGRRKQSNDRRYRWWVDRLKGFGDLRRRPLTGNPYLYHSEPMGFASRPQEGKRENDPEAAVAAACVCAIGQMGFCYHRIASDDPATPGLDLARAATLVPQSPDFSAFDVGAKGAPIERFDKDDFPGGTIYCCSNGSEAWAVGYGKRVATRPRVEWRGLTPQEIWRGERVILWQAG
jgi:uncharacterized Zn-binding protein involved in type VI secretion